MSAREHLYKSEAVVIKRSDLGEADKILTIFTPHFGKLRVVAKGVRKVSSRLAGHVELFTRNQMLLA
ncbi:MAG: DNA repair protein RecO, partial [Chloroflexota bacterium]|nr:DNA repair protein RecO [Chloroflexota bacterium]